MNKSFVNFIVDTLAFTAILFLAATGILLKYILPAGSGHFLKLWGMGRHEWGNIHFWIAIALLVVLAIHLSLHWRWTITMIRGTAPNRSPRRLILAIVSVVILLGLACSPFILQVEESGKPPHKMRTEEFSESPAADQINGSMTLQEIEKLTGVSAAVILRELKLPIDTPINERLGRLRKQYNFELHDVRAIVDKHSEKQ